jgi:WD40 repeat protein
VAFSSDGNVLATAGYNITLWNVETGDPLKVLGTGDQIFVNSLKFGPEGHILVSGREDGAVLVWSLDDNYMHVRSTVKSTEGSEFGALDLDTAGEKIAIGHRDGLISFWDTAAQKTAELPREHANPIRALAFVEEGTTLLSGDGQGLIVQWDLVTDEAGVIADLGSLHVLAFGAGGHLMAWSPSGGSREVFLRDISLGVLSEKVFLGSHHQVQSIAISPDGEMLAAGDWSGFITFWDVASSEIISQVHYLDSAWYLAFSPDSRLLAAGSGNGTVLLVDIQGAFDISELRGHRSYISALAFGQEGKILVTGDTDGRIILWDVEGSRMITDLPEHSSAIHSLDLDRNGRFLVSGSRGQVDIYVLDPEEWLSEVCTIAGRGVTQWEWLQFVGADIPYAPVCTYKK